MPLWNITPDWKGQEAYLIGGGPSLKDFDFNLLKGKNTIACNHAYHLGPEIVKVVLFGDTQFFHKNKWELEAFEGTVASCATGLSEMNLPWLWQLNRERDGLYDGQTIIGWNYSTGAAAVNVALALGAHRIFLLGYDMTNNDKGKSHWHNYSEQMVQRESYARFLRGFENIARALRAYPRVQVINVTDGSSKLPFFTRWTYAMLEHRLMQTANRELVWES